ncbi:hypothetical protein GCM10020220_020920 [Nonomuraea rubra]
MGVVWEGHDTLLNRQVAIKEVLLPETMSPGDQERQLLRTAREARTAAKLNHPSVVAVYDVIEEDGRPWIVMELVSHPTVEQVVLTTGALPCGRRPTWAGRCCRRCGPPTRRASCTVTSSRATSCCPRTAGPCSWTSASPRSRAMSR